MSNDNQDGQHPPLLVLDDGQTFGGAEGANVLCYKGQVPDDITEDLEDGEVDSLFEAIQEEIVAGSVIKVSQLLELRELSLELTEADANDPAKMKAFIEAVKKLDLR